VLLVRADRLISILLLLQSHGRLPARVLAERLEVSERTINRDMEALSMAGVPVYAERGRRGGWALTEDYRTDLTGLDESELRSVVFGAPATVLADLGLAEAAERAVVKLLAALPEGRRREAENARAYLHVDPAGWRRTEEVAAHLPALELALRTRRRAVIRYERAFEPEVVEREVDPLGLVAKGATWYLVAAVGDQVRTYRASRIRDVRLLDEPAVRPPDFDLADWWAASRAEYEAMLPVFRATVRIAAAALPRARMGWRFGRIEEEVAPGDAGWTTCRVRFDSLDAATEAIVGLGPDAEVVEPEELRDAVVEVARAILSRAT
jgi:predicted DNA-binding transcriptional regulator YafY